MWHNGDMTTNSSLVHRQVNAVTERIPRAQAHRAVPTISSAWMWLGRTRFGASGIVLHQSCARVCGVGTRRTKEALKLMRWPNVAIVSAYNDMLSAHQPLDNYPALIKRAAREAGAVAQFAGGVPAMCDGVTQGQPGMELSLFSRDVIAMPRASPWRTTCSIPHYVWACVTRSCRGY